MVRSCAWLEVVVALALVPVVPVLGGGCQTNSGLIVEVKKDSSVTSHIETLHFVVGTQDESGLFVKDGSSSVDVPVSGRDLVANPYRLLVHDDGGSPDTVQVVVQGMTQGQVVAFGFLDGAQEFIDGSLLLRRVLLKGDVQGRELTTGCVMWASGDATFKVVPPDDLDCDGVKAGTTPGLDCDDTDPLVGPDQQEVCNNDKDDDCDGMTDESEDGDHDTVTVCDGDCADGDDTVAAGFQEVCDGKDNDCNQLCDDGIDGDDDHVTTCGSVILEDGTCQTSDLVGKPIDCDDGDMFTFPGAPEICDGKDNDENGASCDTPHCDDDPALDPDHDKFTECGTILGRCMTPDAKVLGDCAPDNGAIHPFAEELCDGVDTNCDDQRASERPCFALIDPGTGIVSCQLGKAGCDDDSGDGTFGTSVCQKADGASQPAPGVVCETYASCANNVSLSSEDPLVCMRRTLPVTGTLSCTQAFKLSDASLCPGMSALPTDASTACIGWSFLGGPEQVHYDYAYLASDSGTPSPTLAQCGGLFEVTRKVNTAEIVPQAETLFLIRETAVDVAANLYRVDLTPTFVSTCPVNGLVCSPLAATTGP